MAARALCAQLGVHGSDELIAGNTEALAVLAEIAGRKRHQQYMFDRVEMGELLRRLVHVWEEALPEVPTTEQERMALLDPSAVTLTQVLFPSVEAPSKETTGVAAGNGDGDDDGSDDGMDMSFLFGGGPAESPAGSESEDASIGGLFDFGGDAGDDADAGNADAGDDVVVGGLFDDVGGEADADNAGDANNDADDNANADGGNDDGGFFSMFGGDDGAGDSDDEAEALAAAGIDDAALATAKDDPAIGKDWAFPEGAVVGLDAAWPSMPLCERLRGM